MKWIQNTDLLEKLNEYEKGGKTISYYETTINNQNDEIERLNQEILKVWNTANLSMNQ